MLTWINPTHIAPQNEFRVCLAVLETHLESLVSAPSQRSGTLGKSQNRSPDSIWYLSLNSWRKRMVKSACYAMPTCYPIIQIKPEWVLEQETLGSKEKFWYRENNNASRWLFKFPEPNTGQHWAEKIAAEIADLMGILHAKVELAVFQEKRGSATQSFARDARELWHGNQILAGTVFGYSSEQRFRHSEHTLEHIFQALDAAILSEDGRRRAKQAISNYLVLDAVIGNTDRHHENWAILRKHVGERWLGWIAPTFDHASSLGRELVDTANGKCRQRLLKEKRVGGYAEKGTGAIYFLGTEKKGPSPLELVRLALQRYPELFQPAISRVEQISKVAIDEILTRMPSGWMTDISIDFVREFLAYSISELLKLKK